jgi:hypothetical protein
MKLNFNPFEDQQECQILIQLGDKIVQQIELPIFFAYQQFGQLILQTMKDSRPFQVKCIIKEYIEDETAKGKVLDNYLAFQNKAFIEVFSEKEENKNVV